MSLYEQIKEQADTIEMLSGERPVGVRLTREQIDQLRIFCPPLGGQKDIQYDVVSDTLYVCGLRIEVKD